MTDFFKQLVGLAGYGLVGIAIVMVIVLAYVILKKPNNKFAILVLTGFCVFVIALFTYAGVGLKKENDSLNNSNKDLSKSNEKLSDSISTANTKLNIASKQIALTNPDLSRDSIKLLVQSIVRDVDTLTAKNNNLAKAEWINFSNRYKAILENLNKAEYKPEDARKEILENSKKIPISVIKNKPVTTLISHH